MPTSDIMTPASDAPLTYVAAGSTANISLPNYYGAYSNVTGSVAYENFAFGGLISIQGQGFLGPESEVSIIS